MMVEVDERGHLIYVSPTVTQVLGYQPEELAGRRGYDWVHPDDLARLAELVKEFVEVGESGKVVYRARHKRGHWVWLETTSKTYRDAEGLTRTVAFTRDVLRGEA